MVGRRGFLKAVGAAALAVVAAPLYVPSERLEFGVPTRRLVTPEPPTLYMPSSEWGERAGTARILKVGTAHRIAGGHYFIQDWTFGKWNGPPKAGVSVSLDGAQEPIIAGYTASELQEISRRHQIAELNTRVLQEAWARGGIVNVKDLGMISDPDGAYAVNALLPSPPRV